MSSERSWTGSKPSGRSTTNPSPWCQGAASEPRRTGSSARAPSPLRARLGCGKDASFQGPVGAQLIGQPSLSITEKTRGYQLPERGYTKSNIAGPMRELARANRNTARTVNSAARFITKLGRSTGRSRKSRGREAASMGFAILLMGGTVLFAVSPVFFFMTLLLLVFVIGTIIWHHFRSPDRQAAAPVTLPITVDAFKTGDGSSIRSATNYVEFSDRDHAYLAFIGAVCRAHNHTATLHQIHHSGVARPNMPGKRYNPHYSGSSKATDVGAINRLCKAGYFIRTADGNALTATELARKSPIYLGSKI